MEFKENMSQEDFDKAIQSAQDKVRTEYSQKLKEIQSQSTIKDQTIEEQLEALKQRNLELEQVNHKMQLSAKLAEKGLSVDLIDLIDLNGDVDAKLDKLSSLMTVSNAYIPSGHSGDSNLGMTQEQFGSLSYQERAQLADTNPSLYVALSTNNHI